MGNYSVILADPPWPFRVWEKGTGSGRSAASHYPTMDLDQICALPIADLAADNCALFLWSVWPSIFDARRVIEAWGFTYRTLGWEWLKLNKSSKGIHFGMGYYTRASVEPCLLAVKGSMSVDVRNMRNVIMAPVSEHSSKPDEQYSRIQTLYPGETYLELFARQAQPGWDFWGNNVQGGIDIYDPD